MHKLWYLSAVVFLAAWSRSSGARGEGAALSAAKPEAVPPAAVRPATSAAAAAPVPLGVTAATVNGEPIYWTEVDAGMPKPGLFGTMFGGNLEQLRQAKLARLIRSRVLQQYLKTQQIVVTEKEIDAEVQKLRQTPPASGCSCCRYASLEDFMDTLAITMAELRAGVANDLGAARYLRQVWEREFPAGPVRDGFLERQRPRLEREYIHVSHSFWNTFQNPRFQDDPAGVRLEAKAKAMAAWKRLQAGEAFPELAQALSEDAVSRAVGGALGCIPADAFGKQFADAALALKPGQVGKPVESPWGWHIIRREQLTDADLLDLLKDDFTNRRWAEEQQRIQKQATVERVAKPAN